MADIIKMPKLSDTMLEGVIASWQKKVGDKVSLGDVLAEIESDKATMEFESFYAGVLLHVEVEAGKPTPVDSMIAIIGKEGEDIQGLITSGRASAPLKEQASVTETKNDSKPEQIAKPIELPKPKDIAVVVQRTSSVDNVRQRISPLARRLAEERGLNLKFLSGTGEGGRIVKRDIEQQGSNQVTITGIERFRDVEISQMRKTIARRLGESKFTAPHFYLTIDLDMDHAVEARESINKVISPEKISYNDLVIKAVSASLKEHPQVNAGWHDTFIRYNEHVHVGVAVAVEDGLLVPVVRFADQKSLTQISKEVRDYAQRAKQKKLQPQDWEGNTFTISNLGMFGIEDFTAIINPPDSCIMAVGSIRQEPVVKQGEIRIGNRMKVTLSCDHRVVDGVTGAKFLDTFRTYIENPIVLLGRNSI